MCHKKKQLKFENYKTWLEATQIENKINHLEKNKIDKDRIKKSPKEFIKKNQLILKHNKDLKVKSMMFTEKANENALSSNDDKRM